VVGPRLWRAQNAAWAYPFPRVAYTNAQGPWFLRQPITFPSRAATTFTGSKTFRDIGFSGNGAVTPDGVLLIGANTSDQYSVWASDGSALSFGATTRFTITAASKILGCSATWDNPGKDPNGGADISEGMTVFSHTFGTHVYYLLDSGASIRSLTTDVTNCPAGASALAVHLDRLWLGRGKSVYYTDPLNADSIRTTNVIRVNGDVRCLIPGQFGAIDTSGVPHLIIGTPNGVEILDGDPKLGGGLQADKRTLLDGVGMASPHCAALTPYGVFFLATDGNLWMIPLGTQQAFPVGEPVRNLIGLNNLTATLDADSNATGSVVWMNPYLYIYPGGETNYHFVAEPTREGIARFWGPVTLNSDIGAREAVIRAATDSNLSLHDPVGAHVTSVHSVTMNAPAETARYLVFDPRTAPTGSYPNGGNMKRASWIQTGLLNQPGHRVQCNRVILETAKIPATTGTPTTVAWTVEVFDEMNNSVTGVRLPESAPAAGTYDPKPVITQHFAFPPLPASRGISIRITATTEADLALQRAFAELHVTPAQF
jgi:hypothetical protein